MADPTLEPLKPTDARKLARAIIDNGMVDFTGHALDEMAKDDLQTTDCLNLVRGGDYGPAEYRSGEWRYRVSTQRICIVIAFMSETHLRVVTAWRIKT